MNIHLWTPAIFIAFFKLQGYQGAMTPMTPMTRGFQKYGYPVPSSTMNSSGSRDPYFFVDYLIGFSMIPSGYVKITIEHGT